jgi:predicted transcriptional regulator
MVDVPIAKGRRSKQEIACDVLEVVSKGVGKPTRIMQLANLTWNDLFVYLAALLEAGFLIRRQSGGRFEFEITEKGESTLSRYTELKKELAQLNLESVFAPVAASPRFGDERTGPALLTKLIGLVGQDGLHVEKNRMRGKSGVVHTFDCVAADSEGQRHAFMIRKIVRAELILAVFMAQQDTETPVTIYYTRMATAEAKKLARVYSLNLWKWAK